MKTPSKQPAAFESGEGKVEGKNKTKFLEGMGKKIGLLLQAAVFGVSVSGTAHALDYDGTNLNTKNDVRAARFLQTQHENKAKILRLERDDAAQRESDAKRRANVSREKAARYLSEAEAAQLRIDERERKKKEDCFNYACKRFW